MDLLGELHRDGMTIVQVTHNEEFATEGSRVIRLFDGWIEKPAYNLARLARWRET